MAPYNPQRSERVGENPARSSTLAAEGREALGTSDERLSDQGQRQ
jgi:hypothetical protein